MKCSVLRWLPTVTNCVPVKKAHEMVPLQPNHNRPTGQGQKPLDFCFDFESVDRSHSVAVSLEAVVYIGYLRASRTVESFTRLDHCRLHHCSSL